ncbi:MAG: histidine phosphatase family protein [Gammaproteobacteria bacterium]|nr:histidine phosphatase family protein [Gammaproteobacteria bacterium]
MFELMLMRHAKSDWSVYTADIDRPLSGRGRRDAILMGDYLNQHKLTPDRMVVSAAQRTRETADLLLKNLSLDKNNIIIDRELYLADRETLCEAIELYARNNKRLLILAHNPGMDDVVSYLSATRPPLSSNGKLMTTAAVACFYMDSPQDVKKPDMGKLQHLFRPKEIAEIAGI